MADYICRDEYLKKLYKEINASGEYTSYEAGLEDAYFYAENMPAADVQQVKLANETAAMYAEPDEVLEDRKLFVHNLGEVIKQTRDGVISVELDPATDIVTITYRGGGTHTVNVSMDSYAAIIRDVSKHIT